MKTVPTALALIMLCFAASSTHAAGRDATNDVAVIAAAIPTARTIEKTSTGYRVFDGKNTIHVDRNSLGYHYSNGKNTIFIDKTSTGYRISPTR